MNKTHPLRTPPSPLLYTCPFMRHTLSSASPLNCQLVACLPHLFHPTLNYHPLDCLLPPSFPSIHIIPLKLTPFSTAILFDCLPPLLPSPLSTAQLVPLPHVYIAWVPGTSSPPYPEDSVYSAPVYLSLEREVMLTQVALPARRGAHQWILAGAAVFLGAD